MQSIDTFRPHPLLRNGHLQTIYGAMVTGPLPPYTAERHIIELGDGESMVVHEEKGRELDAAAPMAILVHGLGGDHSSPYMRRIAHQLCNQNIRTWRVDLRGCGAGLQHAYRPAHAGSSSDLAAVVAAAEQQYPRSSLAIAAFSLGGNILLKMLGELADGQYPQIDTSRIAKAMAIAPPADLHSCCVNMERFSRKVYTKYYLKMLGRQVRARAEKWEPWRAIRPATALRTIRHFDHWYTAPLAGFASTDEYYCKSSAKHWLNKIQVPTRVLLDKHDPIIPIAAFEGITFGSAIEVEHTRFGGHLGYLGIGPRGTTRRWMDEWTVALIGRFLNTHQK